MTSYALRRLLTTVPIILLITLIAFMVMNVLPGDPALVLLGQEATPDSLAVLRERMGLNRPLHEQYLSWLGGLFRFDLGNSLIDNTPVARAIAHALPVTLQITIMALGIALLIGVPAGILSATRRGGVWDAVASFTALSGISLPGFWVAILLIYLLSVQYSLLPSSGFVRFSENPWQSILHSLLPAIALGLRPAGIFMRMVRSSLLDVVKSDYIRTARAKGLEERTVILRHALRSALIPLFTVVGVEFASLLGNVVVIDTIFALPGFGRLIYNSFLRFDFTMIQSLLLVFAVAVIAINLLTDFAYSLVDPRIRYS